jgi:hypothetical protein
LEFVSTRRGTEPSPGKARRRPHVVPVILHIDVVNQAAKKCGSITFATE